MWVTNFNGPNGFVTDGFNVWVATSNNVIIKL